MKNTSGELADFGYRKVARDEKTRLVKGVFDSVAKNYDLMNDLMSAGLHRPWKSAFIRRAAPRPGEVFLDVAGGTGDIAFRIAAAGARVVVADINASMIEVGRDRAIDRNVDGSLVWSVGDAQNLPYPDRIFDAVTVAFGLRNMTDIPAALADMFRVLKIGGRFLCLEFSRPQALVEPLYDAYSFKILPKIGAVVAEDEDSYRYLAESIRKFPDKDRLARLMAEAGFERTTYESMAAGICAIHIGWRL